MNTKEIEIQLLLDAMHMKYGYDFSGYSREMLTRRIESKLSKSNLNSITEMTSKVIHDPEFFSTLIYEISIPVTEMFRDPSVYVSLKEKVFPILKTFPYINIWHAGCATGEEVYSMAIALKEEGLYDRCQIYATDINDRALKKAREGIYPVDRIQKYTQNYQEAGGKTSFSNYYHAMYDSAKIDESLKENITFASHNLVTDGVFAEMNLILCRNVFIYFDKTLQNKVLELFDQSLCRNGFLCMGSSESITFSVIENDYTDIASKEKIYQKKAMKASVI
jgi:chemotaxis protein methyltransferase CheR